MPKQRTESCLLVTDDARLIAKAKRLLGTVDIRLYCYTPPSQFAGAVVEARDSIADIDDITTIRFIFLDLDMLAKFGAAQNNGKAALKHCTQVIERFPSVSCVAFALSPDPALVQQAKLQGLSYILQRFKFEELLKSIATMPLNVP